jgi:hypothetical protein
MDENLNVMKMLMIIAIFTSVTFGCVCGDKQEPLCDYYECIFIGKLLRIDNLKSDTALIINRPDQKIITPIRKYTFSIEISIKQVNFGTIQIYQTLNDCTFDFIIGKKYLVTASKYNSKARRLKVLTDKLTTSSCLSNYNLSDSQK